jgi:low affinity Fe/Cu permease
MQKKFAYVARLIVVGAASAYTTITALMLVGVWLAIGPFVGFSDTWQLWANTVTTIITNLLAFLILNAQTRDTESIQAKLDELIFVTKDANNRLIAIERGDEDEVKKAHEEIIQRGEADGDGLGSQDDSTNTGGDWPAGALFHCPSCVCRS